jgi:hypothetical protein
MMPEARVSLSRSKFSRVNAEIYIRLDFGVRVARSKPPKTRRCQIPSAWHTRCCANLFHNVFGRRTCRFV